VNDLRRVVYKMVTQQHEFNKEVSGDDWQKADNNWLRCIWIECAEVMGYLEWKWWGKQHAHEDLMTMELVDVFIFGISHDIIQNAGDLSCVADNFVSIWEETSRRQPPPTSDIPDYVEQLVVAALYGGHFCAYTFCCILQAKGLSITDLFFWYFGKNALNQLRQHHGYKQGRYKKVWGGVDDNLVLSGLLKTKKLDADTAFDVIYAELDTMYAEVA